MESQKEQSLARELTYRLIFYQTVQIWKVEASFLRLLFPTSTLFAHIECFYPGYDDHQQYTEKLAVEADPDTKTAGPEKYP